MKNQGGQGKKMKGRGIKGVGKEIKWNEGSKGSSRGCYGGVSVCGLASFTLFLQSVLPVSGAVLGPSCQEGGKRGREGGE